MEPQKSIFPVWAIITTIILVVVLLAAIIFFIRRRRSRLLSVDTIHKHDEERLKEVKTVSSLSLEELDVKNPKLRQQQNEDFSESTFVSVPLPLSTALDPRQQAPPQVNEKTDKPASIIDESEYDYPPPEPLQEIKISLPLPPPSTSFFSDKMEVGNSNAQDLFDVYLSTKQTEQKNHNENSEFVSIDLHTSNFYLNATSSVQQKADNTKATFRNSLKAQHNLNGNSSQNLLFSSADNMDEQQTAGKSGVINPLTPKHHSITKLNDNSRQLAYEEKTDTDIDYSTTLNENTKNHLQSTIKGKTSNENHIVTLEGDSESPVTPYYANLQEPTNVVRRVIRSASRKAKTLSVVSTGNRDSFANSLNDKEKEEDKLYKNGTSSRHGSIRYASVRGLKAAHSSNEHMTITSGSMRRFVNESILLDNETPNSIPAALSATFTSTRKSSTKKSNVNVLDIAGWWEAPKTSNPATVTATTPTIVNVTDDNLNDNMMLPNISSSEGSLTSHTPPQYQASLATSVFAFNNTLSKAAKSNFTWGDDGKEDGGHVSRHGSFKRGTLGRNTLRSITASATNGVNRSLKGLFDHASSNSISNKIAPDDSQKTELCSDSQVDAMDKNHNLDQNHHYGSIRRKSKRVSTINPRSSLSASCLTSLESSTKYALNDGDTNNCVLDESSQKTAIEEHNPKSLSAISLIQQKSPIQSSQSIVIQAQHTTPTSVVEKHEGSNLATGKASTSNDMVSGEVDTIRRMLQDTWIKNMKESGSSYSMLSETGSIVTISACSPTSTSKSDSVQPITSSVLVLRANNSKSMSLSHDELDTDFAHGPQPTASFSSSTVRTVVPELDQPSEPIVIRQNAIQQKHASFSLSSSLVNGSNKIQASSYDDKSHYLMDQHPSSPVMSGTTFSYMSNNNSTTSSRVHSRKSSGDNSTATALRISYGYSSGAKTWNGRAQKRFSDKSSVAWYDASENMYNSIGSASMNKRGFFSTMRKGQKARGGIPWMFDNDQQTEDEKTPAQIERDKYLEENQ
ncbi:MAG: hypothetical protein EXX96DRAFT_651824 [Benjaminiella poitrasii]|nr:MAG: hypothetical protein EXX96DRAFT_651824 [Benjaminiella poitrasii]